MHVADSFTCPASRSVRANQVFQCSLDAMRIFHQNSLRVKGFICFGILIKEKSFWTILYWNAIIFDASVSRLSHLATLLQSVERGANQVAFGIEQLLERSELSFERTAFSPDIARTSL